MTGLRQSISAWMDELASSADPVSVVRGTLHELWSLERDSNPVWISRVDKFGLDAQIDALRERLSASGGDLAALPLFGVPFAVKDNIDVAGFATTAACPAFAYQPDADATVVARLRSAGAIVFGKTNLDQFATGLSGSRSPYGAVANAVDARFVSGGSSSGSAVTVARAEVLFSLGTDTAGSGRVPATLNGIVGLKPTRGLLSTRGVVPACRSLDCVSIFSADLDGVARVLDVARGFDAADAFSRDAVRDGLSDAGWAAPDRLAVPAKPDFFGDTVQQAAWQASLQALRDAGWELVEIDESALVEASALLYDGPWVAERDAAVGDFIRAHPDQVNPVVAGIITGPGHANGATQSARDLFEASYRLADLRRRAEPLWRDFAALVLPGTPTHITLEAMAADPVTLNSRLGRYTNFTNLLDLAALNLPAAARADGLPFGVSLIGAPFSDHRLLALARRLSSAFKAGATAQDAAASPPLDRLAADAHSVPMVVVGAHLSGLPLNSQLTSRGARLVSRTRTAPCYRLYALPGTVPPRPGMVRDAAGAALEIEVWALPRAGWASFIEGIPAPLCIGSVQTESGDWIKGFLCEAHALDGAEEVTALGGWRAYIATLKRT